MNKTTLASCGVWVYAGWVGYEEMVRDSVDWRFGLISFLNCCLFFCYQLTSTFHNYASGSLVRAFLLVVALSDLCLLCLTQAWVLRSQHSFISALGLLAGGANLFVHVSKIVLLVALLSFFALNALLGWADRHERDELGRLLEIMYADKEKTPQLIFSKRELRAFFRECRTGLATLPMLAAEKQIILQEYTRLAEEKELGADCAICLCPFVLGELVSQIACIHVFHPNCILQWFSEKPQCPLCRRPFRFALLRRLFRRRPRNSI